MADSSSAPVGCSTDVKEAGRPGVVSSATLLPEAVSPLLMGPCGQRAPLNPLGVWPGRAPVEC